MKTKNIIYSILMSALMLLPASLGAQTSSPVTPPDGVVMSKKVNYIGPNKYTIDLEAYVTGQSVTIKTGAPLDVVLVLDFSLSLKENNNWDKLRMSAANFLKNIKAYKADMKADVRVGVVSFSSSAQKLTNGLVDPDLTDELISKLENDGLTTGSATQIDEGVSSALYFFENDKLIQGGRNAKRCVVIFTDGYPMGLGSIDDYSLTEESTIAIAAIDSAYELKNTYNAEVYTIGLFGDSIANHPLVSHYGYTQTTVNPNNIALTTTTFLERLSSAYPKAKINNETDEGECTVIEYADGWTNPYDDTINYFQRAESNNLENIFQDISDKVIGGASFELEKTTTTVIDVISSSFKLPDGADGSKINLSVAHCNDVSSQGVYLFEDPVSIPNSLFPDVDAKVGVLTKTTVGGEDSATFTPQENGKAVSVTNFDFSANFVGLRTPSSGSPYYDGYKLIISFPIEMDPAGPGGAHVATNSADSGIYKKDDDGVYQLIGSFEIPYVSIPNIVIKKEGLHQGESATFNVYKIVEGERSGSPMVLVATQTSVNPGDACVVKARVQPGTYEVVEEGWSWAYTTDGSNSITKEVNETTENHDDPACPGTFFNFSNTLKEGIPAHAEASKNNIFYESR